MAEPVALKYRAFVSYSHADTTWAKWLHRALESFHIDKDLVGRETATGTIPKALRPLFRDRDEFTAGHELTDQTQAALDGSYALIVICSPASAKSRYVNEEIRLFKSRHHERPTIPLIVAGKPGDPEFECFPPALSHKVDTDGKITDQPIELLAADVRDEGDGKSLALAKVVAGLLGVSSDDIFRRAMRERRRRQQRWIAGLSVVALALAGLAIWAEINRREAVEQRNRAERTLEAATRTANSLVFDLAREFHERTGMPADLVRNILERAQKLQSQLTESGETAPDLRRGEAIALQDLADTLLALGDTNKALAAAERSRTILKSLLIIDPANSQWQHELSISDNKIGDVLMAEGRRKEALEAYRSSVAIREKLATTEPGNAAWQRDLAISHNKIGDVLQAAGGLDQALTEYRSGLAIIDRLVAAHPINNELRRDQSIAHTKIGDVLMAAGRPEAALTSYREALKLDEMLAAADPGNSKAQRDVEVSLLKIGDVLLTTGLSDEALEQYRKGLAIQEKLALADPGNARWKRDITVSHSKIGDALAASMRRKEALEEYRKGLAMLETLTAGDPDNTQWQRDLSAAHTRIASLLMALGQRQEAIAEYRKGLAIDERLAAADSENVTSQIDLVASLCGLAEAGEAPRVNFTRALEILNRLNAAGKLSPAKKGWITTIEQRLATSPPTQADAR